MRRFTHNLFIRPLLYDALSGEFQPNTDTLKHSPSLGRLAVESYQKGTRVPTVDMQGTRRVRYNPTWAPVTVESGWKRMNQDNLSLSHLAITDGNGHQIKFEDQPHNDRLFIVQGIDSFYLPLGLGEELDHAQVTATEKAQTFFDSIVSS